MNETALHARILALEEALTPSAETKADYMGEFTFESYENMSVTVPWTTIKEIMAYVLKRASQSNPSGEPK